MQQAYLIRYQNRVSQNRSQGEESIYTGIDIGILGTIEHFNNLSDDELNSIQKLITRKTVERGNIFLLEGETCESLYFLIEGMVKVYKTTYNGKEQIWRIARPIESLNDVAIFNKEKAYGTMAAMTPVVLYTVGKDDLETILNQYPHVSHNVIKVLSRRVRRFSILVESLFCNESVERLARFILDYIAEEPGEALPLTQQDVANLIGTCRAVVNKTLKVMEERGAIQLKRNHIMITNREIIKEMAKASPN